jgi:cytochrome c-type biogenesis protein CcmH/NrfG
MNPGYAPTYIELGRAYEAAGDASKAAESYDMYVQLAPNFSDSTAVRQRVQQLRRK